MNTRKSDREALTDSGRGSEVLLFSNKHLYAEIFSNHCISTWYPIRKVIECSKSDRETLTQLRECSRRLFNESASIVFFNLSFIALQMMDFK